MQKPLKKLVKIGQIINAHGIKGELKVHLLSQNPIWLDDLLQVYFQKPEPVKYKIMQKRWAQKFCILKLEGLNDRNQAELLKGFEVFTDPEVFQTDEGETPYLMELRGFEVMLLGKSVGEIVGFSETLAHSLIHIQNPQGHFEIPWVDDFIVKIDRQNQSVEMSFPESLLSEDFNLKED